MNHLNSGFHLNWNYLNSGFRLNWNHLNSGLLIHLSCSRLNYGLLMIRWNGYPMNYLGGCRRCCFGLSCCLGD
jgi:hypothetical protein